MFILLLFKNNLFSLVKEWWFAKFSYLQTKLLNT